MLNRRDAMMRLGQLGLGALTLPQLLQAAPAPARRRHARSCIYLFLWGGPPQQDMWDMKPDAPQGIRSLFSPVRTAVPGINICDQMPRLARLTDKVAFVRSLTHPSDNHEPGVYHLLTFDAEPETLDEVTRVLKITDGVVRHMPTRRPMPHRRATAPVGGGEEYAPPTEAESEGGA